MSETRVIDRGGDLRLGFLAVQMELVDKEAMVRAMSDWLSDSDTSLGDFLVSRGTIAPSRRELLESIARENTSPRGAPSTSGDTLPPDTLDATGATIIPAGAGPIETVDYVGVSNTAAGKSAAPAIETLDPRSSDLATPITKVFAHTDSDGQTRATSAGPSGLEPSGVVSSGGRENRFGAIGPLRYRIVKSHAKGGLGEVFLARDLELSREVALKEIQERHAGRRDSRSRFIREAEITGGLEHPGIVPVYGLGEYDDGRPYYAMRFIRGDTLKEAIEAYHYANGDEETFDPGKRMLELRGLLRRFIDVCNALAYAHSRGVIHRDIKPGNIMLGNFGETLVVDWGLAKYFGGPDTPAGDEPLSSSASSGGAMQTLMGSAVGTPQYMSPEQAEGRLDAMGPAADVYSLGATLFTLLTGRPAFLEPSTLIVIEKVRKGEFPTPRSVDPSIPAALEAICLKAMAIRPEDRYPTAKAMADDVERWLADEPVSVFRDPPLARVARWIRRHRTLAVTAASLLVALSITLTFTTAVIDGWRRESEYNRTQADENRVLAERQRNRAVAEEKLAKENHLKAEENYRLARSAVETMLDDVAAIDIADVPLMEPVRKRMLESALKFYGSFLESHRSDGNLAVDIARAHRRLGDVHELLGDSRGAEENYQSAVSGLEALSREHPENESLRREWATALHNQGVFLKLANRFVEAGERLKKAHAIRKDLAATSNASEQDKRDSAASLYQIGALLARQRGRTPEDENLYHQAIAEQRALVDQFPGKSEFRLDYARSLNNLGMLLAGISPRDSEKTLGEAIKLEKELLAESPSAPIYRRQLARAAVNLGTILQQSNRFAEAEGLYLLAAEKYESLAADFPKVPEYRQELAGVESNLALLSLRSTASMPASAAKVLLEKAGERLSRSIKIRESLVEDFKGRPDFKQSLALSYRAMAELLRRQGSSDDEAERLLRRALGIHEQLLADFPTARDYDFEHAGTLAYLANRLWGKKDFDGAAASMNRAVEILERLAESDERRLKYRQSLIQELAVLASIEADRGVFKAAESAISRLIERIGDDREELPRAAALYALLAIKCGNSANLPVEQRPIEAERHALRAVDVLRRAVSLGFNRPEFFKQAMFDGLRARDDFQAVLKAAEANAQPRKG